MVVLSPLISTAPVIYRNIVDFSPIYASVSSVYTKQSNKFTLERLINMWCIGIETVHHTLKATNHYCISTTGVPPNNFNTDKV